MKQAEQTYMQAGNVKKRIFVLLLLFMLALYYGSAQTKNDQDMKTVQNDEAAIRALMNSFVAAFNSGDIDAIMKNYVPDKSLIIFDVVPRKEYRGADTYRKDWVDMFSHFTGKPEIAIIDLGITVDGSVGFGYSFQRVTGTDKQGKPVNRMVRVTDGYRKIGNNWLIALEHVSVPVDLKTGKANFTFKN
jgi:ketosteroid isomerase-like protein